MREFLLVFCLWFGVSCAPAMQPPPSFTVIPSNADDTVIVGVSAEKTFFDVASPRGIGAAQITRTGGAMPQKIEFRLVLKGLERFVLIFGDERIEVNAPSSDPTRPIESSRRAGSTEDVPLHTGDALWMPVMIVPAGQSIPLAEGHFVLEAPRALVESDVREFRIEWIDFYR
jgi:hypothetical protein